MNMSLSSFRLVSYRTSIIGLMLISLLSLNLAYAEKSGDKKSPPAIEAKLSAQLVTMKNGKPSFSSASKVSPGDIIKYDITYKNISANPISGVVVEGPIPNGTNYISESGKTNLKNKGGVKFEVSADESGKWSVPPVYRMVRQPDGTMKRVEIPASEYKKIRWVLNSAMAAKSTNVFTYWVKVADVQQPSK